MIRIVYHSADFDGWCSAGVARYYFQHVAKKSGTMHPYNYGQTFPFHEFSPGDEVYFLDVSYQPTVDMYDFEKKYGWKVYICDHHKTTIESDLKNYISGGLLDNSLSGCELTWNYFFPDKPMPEVVSALGRYDVWDQSNLERWNNYILPFQMGFNLLEANPFYDENMSRVWLPLLDVVPHVEQDILQSIVSEGRVVLRYQNNINAKLMKWLPEELEFDGLRAIVANSALKSSTMFDTIWDEGKYDIMVIYSKSKYDIGVSLFSTKKDVDCFAIAKNHGGGGHFSAAGFGAKKVEYVDGKIIFT